MVKEKSRKRLKPQDKEVNNNCDRAFLKKNSRIQNEQQDTKDHVIIVGIGASAGGLAAFESFFSAIPEETGLEMGFVLVQHLSPDYKSMLTELVQRYTKMKVSEVTDGIKVQSNCVYIIPPGRDMALLNGCLQLLEPAEPRGFRMPIDFFFKSLAQDQGDRAIGIILSGTGCDGTQGVRAIKEAGGMVMAQNRESAEYDGMPLKAIETALVDYELLPEQMPKKLIAYARKAFSKQSEFEEPQLKSDNTLNKICVIIRDRTGHDFSLYKPSTIQRRLHRRMAVQQIDTKDEYLKFLQQNTTEVEELFRDILIGVTNFFRDPEAFQVLQDQIIPQLFTGIEEGSEIRIWSTGCSTGEEAYSIAILMREYLDGLKKNYSIKIFATDIDSHAIGVARAGIYPIGIAADLTSERLARFFSLEPDGNGYRIHKNIRDMLIFSEQDVIKDPPFSRLNLICCRNLMIYMGGELQKKLIPLFHYALKPGGFLFLGTSETVGEYGNLFTTLDSRVKIYQRKDVIYGNQRPSMHGLMPALSIMSPILPQTVRKTENQGKLPLRELTEKGLLEQADLSGALVNDRGDILFLHGHTGTYLELAPGEMGINNIFKMARDGLKNELTMALHTVMVKKEVVERPNLRIKVNDHEDRVNLIVRKVDPGLGKSPKSFLYLVIFEKVPVVAANQSKDEITKRSTSSEVKDSVATSELIAALKQELQAKDEYIQSANEELEASNEDLKSTNEEMQSINEELQSINEELETSKEELQSVNEELATVNGELQVKVEDLSHVNNDMNNLLAGTEIATIFLNCKLQILRFTPAATRIINLIQSDVGRPVGHISPNLKDYNQLVEDAQTVLDTLIPIEIEVQTIEEKFYTMRILPYRTQESVIEGVVINFIDITKLVQTREALKSATMELQRLAVVVSDANDAITVQDLEGQIKAWNPAAERIYGWTEDEALQMNVRDRIPRAKIDEDLAYIFQLSRDKILKPYGTQRIKKDGSAIEIWLTSTPLVNEEGQMYAISTTEREMN